MKETKKKQEDPSENIVSSFLLGRNIEINDTYVCSNIFSATHDDYIADLSIEHAPRDVVEADIVVELYSRHARAREAAWRVLWLWNYRAVFMERLFKAELV
jgi:hypothetical protein